MLKIPRNSKILSCSHNDMDGVGCQIVLGNFYPNITFINTSYYKINDVMKNIKYDEYDYVFITDISPDDKSLLDISDNIVLIDHHDSDISKASNNPKKNRFIIPGVCATVITKRYIEKMYNVKLDHLNSLTYLINDYDLYTLNYGKSKCMNDIFWKYKYKKFRARFMDGNTRFTPDEMIILRDISQNFYAEWNALEIYDLENTNICVVKNKNFINEIASKLMKSNGYDLVFIKNPNLNRVSIRNKIEGFHVGTFLSERGWGGGHKNAAGLIIYNNKDFIEKVLEIEKHIVANFKECVK